MSVRKCNITPQDIKTPIIESWKEAGWYEISFWTWYFAVEIRLDKNKNIVLRIMDGVHNSEHHNDNMETSPYDETMFYNEQQQLYEFLEMIYYNTWYNLLWGK